MARHLHTAVADEINANAFDAENAAERRMESVEYANEVRGFYDHNGDDMSEFDDDRMDREPEYYCPQCGNGMDVEADACEECCDGLGLGHERPEMDDPMSYGEA